MGEVGEGQSRREYTPYFSRAAEVFEETTTKASTIGKRALNSMFLFRLRQERLERLFFFSYGTKALGTSKHTNKLNKHMLDLSSELCQEGRRKSSQCVVKKCLVLLDTKSKRKPTK